MSEKSDSDSVNNFPNAEIKEDKTQDYGYYYYPERQDIKREGIWDKLTEGRSSARTLKCITNVHDCARKGTSVFVFIRCRLCTTP